MKIALGDTHCCIDINGSTVNTVPGSSPAAYSGGMLALSSRTWEYTAATSSL